jgi:hypothetical protein
MNYTDPYKNYKRLLQTKQFLETRQEVHDNFYEKHIVLIRKYLDVLEASDCGQEAAPILKILITQYECFESFDLKIYLQVCNVLIGNVTEISVMESLENLDI